MRSPRHTHKELFSSRLSPLLSRGGVAAPSRKCREASLDGADGVVLIKKIYSWLNEPPRPRRIRCLREILLMARPPLLRQGGDYALRQPYSRGTQKNPYPG